MAGSVMAQLYESGKSIPQISRETGLNRSRIRSSLLAEGITLRSRSCGVKLAAKDGRLGSGLRGKKRTFTEEHKLNIAKARLAWGEKHARGISLKSSGYIDITRGEDKGRGQHRVIMEKRLKRKLLRREHVHHSDEVRSNNEDENLSVMSISDHIRLHRMQEIAAGKIRERDANGRYC